MKRYSFRYSFLTYKLDQLWFPLAIWALFIIIAVLVQQPNQLMNTTRGYLGAAVPLIGGIMAAYAVLDDPALELRFATPIPAWWMLVERLGLTFLIQAVTALSFEAVVCLLGGNFSMFISIWYIQLAWILPTLVFMALGSLAAMATTQTTSGALFVGLVWIVELIARGWLANNIGKYFLVFMGALMPDHPDLLANHISLLSISTIFILSTWVLLRRQERYI